MSDDPARIDRRRLLGLSAAASAVAAVPYLAGGPAAAAAPTRFWFIRHAESVVNVAPDPAVADKGVTYPLTARGVMQAQALAATVAGEPITTLYASTRLRCLQTADAIGFQKGLVLNLAREAVEIDLGVSLGDPDLLARLQGLLAQWQAGKRSARLGTGESLNDLRERYAPFVRELVARHRDEGGIVVVVAHGGIIGWTAPFIFTNVSETFALDLRNGLPNTGIVKAERRQGGLHVTDWAGRAPG